MTERKRDDDQLHHMPGAIVNVARECIAAGIPATEVAGKIAIGLGQVLVENLEAEQAAAMLRIEAGKIEATMPDVRRAATEDEMVGLARRSHEFINTMQVAGIEERTIVSTVANTCIERVARLNGAAGAADWLRRLAAMVEANAAAIERTARAH